MLNDNGGHVKKVTIVALLVLLAACSSNGSATPKVKYPAKFNLVGDVRLSGAVNVAGDVDDCSGRGAFANMHTDGPVTVFAMNGKKLASGTIKYGTGTDVFRGALVECTFHFIANAVPRKKSYLVSVGERPPQIVTLEQIFARVAAIQMDANQPNVTTTTTTLAG
jgi:hypothetical protein